MKDAGISQQLDMLKRVFCALEHLPLHFIQTYHCFIGNFLSASRTQHMTDCFQCEAEIADTLLWKKNALIMWCSGLFLSPQSSSIFLLELK